MDARLAEVATSVKGRKRPRVLYYSPGGYTTGAGTLVNEKIERAGGENVVASYGMAGPAHLSVGLLVALDPEVILMPRWNAAVDPTRSIADSAIWRNVRAVGEGKVIAIDSKWLTSVSPDGVRGVEEIARVLHAEAFGS